MLLLQQLLIDVNPCTNVIFHMFRVERALRAAGHETQNVSKSILGEKSIDPREYKDPIIGEIGAVFVSQKGKRPTVRGIVVHLQNYLLTRISTLSRSYEPLCYLLLFPTVR